MKEEPIYYSNDCPLVTCMMYCENGYEKDDNGCDKCSCNNNDSHIRLLGSNPFYCSRLQISVMNQCNSNCHSCDISNTEIVLDQCITSEGTKAIDNICNTENINSCPIPYIDCDLEYVCPKVTEITECSQGGISGYTTYQLSLIIKDPAIQNIYAMYGSDLQNKPWCIFQIELSLACWGYYPCHQVD